MMKTAIVILLGLGAYVSSLKIEGSGADGTLFEHEGRNFQTVIVDEDVVTPGSRVDVVVISDVTGNPLVRPLNGGFNRPHRDLLRPEFKENEDGYVLSIQVPEELIIWEGGPDPRFFLEIEDEFEFRQTLAVVLHNAKGSPILPPGEPGDEE